MDSKTLPRPCSLIIGFDLQVQEPMANLHCEEGASQGQGKYNGVEGISLPRFFTFLMQRR